MKCRQRLDFVQAKSAPAADQCNRHTYHYLVDPLDVALRTQVTAPTKMNLFSLIPTLLPGGEGLLFPLLPNSARSASKLPSPLGRGGGGEGSNARRCPGEGSRVRDKPHSLAGTTCRRAFSASACASSVRR